MRSRRRHRTRTFAICLVTIGALAASGCGPSSGTDAVPGTDAAAPADSGVSLQTTATVEALTAGLGTVAALAGPLVPDGDQLRRDRMTATDGDAQNAVEMGIAGNSVVTNPLCVAFNWTTMPLSATVTFTGCVLEATGLSLDGSITVGVQINPTTFMITLAALAIGTDTFDGTIALAFTGTDLVGMQNVTVDLSYTSAASSIALALDAAVTHSPTAGVTLDGSGSITVDGAATNFSMAAVNWATGECLPSSGSITLVRTPPVTLTFLSTTPTTGDVQIQVGSLPAFTQMALLAPCP